MRYQSSGKMMVLIFLLALFSVLGAQQAKDQARKFTQQKKTTEDPWFRQEFFSEQMRAQREVLSPSCKHFLADKRDHLLSGSGVLGGSISYGFL